MGHHSVKISDSFPTFLAFMENLPGLGWIKDLQGRYVYLTPLFTELFNIDIALALGKTDFDYSPKEIAEEYVKHDQQVIKTKKPLKIIERSKHEDGIHYWMVSKFPIKNSKGTVNMIGGVAFDITDRFKIEEAFKKKNEELIKLSKIKTDFTSMVSHELRTPLTAIREGIDIVLTGIDGKINKSQTETLAIAKKNVDRLARLIDGVLDYSGLESGKMRLVKENHNLKSLVQEVFQFMRSSVRKKNISFKLILPKHPLKMYCDGDKIKQILINLINNSIKFTKEKGAITLEATTEKDHIVLSVKDTGIGIKKVDFPTLFEPFSKGSSKQSGSGLGLSVCKLIVEQHGGKIQADPKIKRGSLFSVILPIRSTT